MCAICGKFAVCVFVTSTKILLYWSFPAGGGGTDAWSRQWRSEETAERSSGEWNLMRTTNAQHLQCGVTWILLTYKVWASCQTRLSKTWWGTGPTLKYRLTTWVTCGFVGARPHWLEISMSLCMIFCLRKLNNSSSVWVMILCPAAAILEEREGKPPRSHDHPWGGGGNAG